MKTDTFFLQVMTIKLYGMILQRKSVTCDLTLIFVGDEENCNNADTLFESATMIKKRECFVPFIFRKYKYILLTVQSFNSKFMREVRLFQL